MKICASIVSISWRECKIINANAWLMYASIWWDINFYWIAESALNGTWGNIKSEMKMQKIWSRINPTIWWKLKKSSRANVSQRCFKGNAEQVAHTRSASCWVNDVTNVTYMIWLRYLNACLTVTKKVTDNRD